MKSFILNAFRCIEDILNALAIMFWMALICSIPTYIFWNSFLTLKFHCPTISIFETILLNLTINIICFFKLTKKDVVVAEAELEEEFEEDLEKKD